MLPIVTPAEMALIDASAPVPVEDLIARAGWAVHRVALDMLGGAYGRRVRVLAGKGKNGADGDVAAALLRRRGVVVDLHRLGAGEPRTRPVDLVIDACVGTGLTRPFSAPDLGDAPVLAVDVPSGLDSLTGARLGDAIHADRTIAFGALKPGMLFGSGPELCGEVSVDTLDLDCSRARAHLVTDADVSAGWPRRDSSAHKWRSAVLAVGGSAGMGGALSLTGEAAARAGSGLVAVATPGALASGHRESVSIPLPATEWIADVARLSERFGAIVVGPGLDPGDENLAKLFAIECPMVIDAGALAAARASAEVLRARDTPAVLTPHDGEFKTITGRSPGPDRIAATRALAAELQSVVLLKGGPTVVADGDGDVRVATSGDATLATAGSGDVLSGMIGAGLALGLVPLHAAGLAAHAHGRAGTASVFGFGTIAGDLLHHVARALLA